MRDSAGRRRSAEKKGAQARGREDGSEASRVCEAAQTLTAASLEKPGDDACEGPQIFQMRAEDLVEAPGIYTGVHVHEQVPKPRHGLQPLGERRIDKACISKRVETRGVLLRNLSKVFR